MFFFLRFSCRSYFPALKLWQYFLSSELSLFCSFVESVLLSLSWRSSVSFSRRSKQFSFLLAVTAILLSPSCHSNFTFPGCHSNFTFSWQSQLFSFLLAASAVTHFFLYCRSYFSSLKLSQLAIILHTPRCHSSFLSPKLSQLYSLLWAIADLFFYNLSMLFFFF